MLILWNNCVRKQLMLLAVVAIFILIGTSRQGEAAVVKSHSGHPVVARGSLRIITPAVIRDRNLTLNWDLQEYISNTVRRCRSGLISVAVINPRTGDILALYGKDASGENCSLPLNTYLAASLFKVVTATAAIDYAGMSVNSTCSYTGSAHTLYKSQLSEPKKKRWLAEETLARAFASSNNVVFGKIGALRLGEAPLLLTAMRLGFWKSPVMDAECTPSTVFIPESQFNLAELASGYNRYTKMSAVHAAQMVSTVINEGAMVRPRILRSSETTSDRVMCRETANELRAMMCQTVIKGTVSGVFNNYQRDAILKGLSIGAKTGTIDGVDPEGRRRWFMGFAEDTSTGEAITVGCLVIRDSNTRADTLDLAKGIIRHYFAKPAMVATNN